MRPLIGIPLCLEEEGRFRSGRETHYADPAYGRAVAEAGGLPVHVGHGADPEALADRLDGLLVPGGDDFPPDPDRDPPYPAEVRFAPAPARQRAFDAALLAAVLERDLPVLAICYGMQLLALHCGGSLHFDLASDLPGAAPHRLADPESRHPVDVAAGSRLAGLLGAGALAVNSRHHQAVAREGDARVSARAADGVVEAIELAGARFALGVQWHPETMDVPHRARLFGPFVRACAGRTDAAGPASAARG